MIPGGVNELLLRSAAAGGATAGRSVRFNSADSAYLSRTPASAGNQKLWTFSFWYKTVLQDASNRRHIFTARDGSGNHAVLNFRGSDDKLEIYYYAGSLQFQVLTTAIFRDPSAWYHVVVAYDTDQATASNRIKLYVNGTQITAFDTANYPTLGYSSALWNSTNAHAIGRENTVYLSGYLALVHFIDGQALTPSSFGETSATTGRWEAKTYAGTYGTNGFFLDFADNSTAAALGYDAAGSNDWTVNNLSVTAGSGNDSLRDHPTSAGTSTGLGGEVSGNYCTWNPIHISNGTYSNGNLDFAASGANVGSRSTIAVSSGKWYAEFTLSAASNQAALVGIQQQSSTNYAGFSSNSYGYVGYGQKGNSDSWTSYGASYNTNDVIGVALDLDAGTLVFYKNGVSQGTAFTGISGTFFFSAGKYDGSATCTWVANFGQRAWAYTCPSGFSPLVDTLLPTPTIAKPNTVMDVVAYTGNGTNDRTITTALTTVGLAWVKSRNIVDNHRLADVVRGGNAYLMSNLTGAEGTATTVIRSFSGATFNLGTDSSVNTNNDTYVAWTWDAGSSNATNTSGTITSTVRANISAGFSIVTYTGNGGTATVGHGLGVTPSLVVVKSRSTAGEWPVWFTGFSATEYMYLHSTLAKTSYSPTWGSTPTSSVFGVTGGSGINNNSGTTYVAYCWAPVAGYSAFGSYTGTGSATDSPFIWTGFRPAVVIVKRSNGASDWVIQDNRRPGYNTNTLYLRPNSSSEETDSTGETNKNYIDFLSNGFKLRGSDLNTNAAQTYIYCAWAEAPFPYSRAR